MDRLLAAMAAGRNDDGHEARSISIASGASAAKLRLLVHSYIGIGIYIYACIYRLIFVVFHVLLLSSFLIARHFQNSSRSPAEHFVELAQTFQAKKRE